MPYPAGIDVTEHPPAGGWDAARGPVVVLVHGSLDRGASFARTARRLPDLAVVTYDRRGYQGSRDGSAPAGLAGHVEDLLAVAAALPGPPRPVTAVGHSVGGDVVVAAALAEPRRFASIGAYEPPMPWLGFHRPDRPPRHPGNDAAGPVDGPGPAAGPASGTGPAPTPADGNPADDPGTAAATRPAPPAAAEQVERFFRRMVGDAAWERLPERAKRERWADAPALAADLAGLGGDPPFDATALAVPVAFGRGGPQSRPDHRDTVAWLVAHVPGAVLVTIEGAGHGAHLTHPDAFAAFVRTAVDLAGTSGGAAGSGDRAGPAGTPASPLGEPGGGVGPAGADAGNVAGPKGATGPTGVPRPAATPAGPGGTTPAAEPRPAAPTPAPAPAARGTTVARG